MFVSEYEEKMDAIIDRVIDGLIISQDFVASSSHDRREYQCLEYWILSRGYKKIKMKEKYYFVKPSHFKEVLK